MNRFLKRVGAYIIDILVITIFAACLSNIDFINVQLKDYNNVYSDYKNDNEKYSKFVEDFKDYYSDKEITEDEAEKLKKNHEEYYSNFVEKKYEDKKITKKEYNSILEDAKDKYAKLYKDYYYEMKKYSIVTNIIYIVVILCYFVGFQMLTNGQTLGKKIMKLRVASIKKEEKPTMWQYLVRALILYNTIFYFTDIIIVLCVSKASCYNVLYVFGMIQNVVEWIILFMIAMNQDGRGLHDYLASTIVVGINEKVEDVRNANNKIVDAKYEEKNVEVKDEDNKDETKKEVKKKTSSTAKKKASTSKKKSVKKDQ